MSLQSPAHVCPITQQEIEHGILLRGAWFETEAVVRLVLHALHNDERPKHPYERSCLTSRELRCIHAEACRIPDVQQILAELGYTTSFPNVAGRRRHVHERARAQRLQYCFFIISVVCSWLGVFLMYIVARFL